MRRRLILTALALLAFATPSVRAMYTGDVELVPVERLVQNLARLAAREPQNVTYRLNLARAHAMAYAREGDSIRVMRGHEELGPWPNRGSAPGDTDPAMPSKIDRGRTSPAGNEHLTAAIMAYEEVLKNDPANAIARLGHAWCLQESGDRGRAIAEYRALIAELGPRRPLISVIPSVVREAESYLILLLNPERDATEIAKLQADLATRIVPRLISPIVIPLHDRLPPAALVDDTTHVHFDADGTALDRTWTWISDDAAWLVSDPHRTGRIASALQLFGNVTFLLFWENGYQALTALDDNADGELRGRELDGLALWHDVNHNGISDPEEVHPLADWNIVALSTRHVVDDENAISIASSSAGVTFADGSTRPTYDILLRTAASR
jgi:hypothetical protein